MTEEELKAYLDSEITQAMGWLGGELSGDRADSLKYYLGEPRGDEQEGQSQVISSDVRDTVEEIMPQLMNLLMEDGVIEFCPMGPMDVEPAEKETQAVEFQLKEQNEDWFINLYTWLKDALIQKNGTIRVRIDDSENVIEEKLQGLTEDEVLQLGMDDNVEVKEYEAEGMGFNITIDRTDKRKRIEIDVIAPENIGVSRYHDSIFLDRAPFFYIYSEPTVGELIEMGYDAEEVYKLPDADDRRTEEDNARDYLTDEQHAGSTGGASDDLNRRVSFYECYCRLALDGDKKAALWKIDVGGEGKTILEKEKLDYCPVISASPIIMSHRFHGLSIADLVMDIQDIKTTVQRQMLTNLFAQNTGRMAVNENVNLDDLLDPQINGVVRVDTEGNPLEHMGPLVPNLVLNESLAIMEKFDKIREDRTGANSLNTVTPEMLNNNKGDMSVLALLDKMEGKVQLVARIFAEVGLKQLYKLTHRLMKDHMTEPMDMQLGGEWQQVIPAKWPKRDNVKVNVGIGANTKQQKLMGLSQVIQYQQMQKQAGLSVLVSPSNEYAALRDFAKLTGLNSENYYTDPTSQEAQVLLQSMQQQQAQQEQMNAQQMQMQFQIPLQMEQIKAQARTQTEQMRIEIDRLKLELEAMKHNDKMEQDYRKMADNKTVELTKTEAQYGIDVPGSVI